MCLALPARVTRLILPENALVALAGVQREISLALVDEVAPGDYVIVHAGYALKKLDPAEAEKTLALFREAGSATTDNA
jgi:hydrogenase expression/formation protein HypC